MFPRPAQNLVVATSGVGDAHRVDVALERKAVLVDAVNALHVPARRFKYFRVVSHNQIERSRSSARSLYRV
jgi:hypothetical protein